MAPHITTEVDCESLFSQTGHLSHPNRARTIAETFERLSMSKHRLSRIYCCRKRVIAEFLERWRKKLWSNDDDRDDVAFWDQQKEEYLKFAGEEEIDNDGDMVQGSGSVDIKKQPHRAPPPIQSLNQNCHLTTNGLAWIRNIYC